MAEFVEVGLLAGSQCLLHSRSGFSEMAIWWSNITACQYTMTHALDYLAKAAKKGSPRSLVARGTSPTWRPTPCAEAHVA